MKQNEQMLKILKEVYSFVHKDVINGRWCERCNEDVVNGARHKEECTNLYILKKLKSAITASENQQGECNE